jgi:hypothetical protein
MRPWIQRLPSVARGWVITLDMRGLSKSLIAGGFAAAVMASAFVAPALAFGVQTIDPSSLSPAQRTRALTAPLGDTAPFGEPASPGCRWSRLQMPTPQGLQWIDVENCPNKD